MLKLARLLDNDELEDLYLQEILPYLSFQNDERLPKVLNREQTYFKLIRNAPPTNFNKENKKKSQYQDFNGDLKLSLISAILRLEGYHENTYRFILGNRLTPYYDVEIKVPVAEELIASNVNKLYEKWKSLNKHRHESEG